MADTFRVKIPETKVVSKYNKCYYCEVNMNEESKKLGANLKRIRMEKSMSQADLCRELEVDKGFLSNIEAGKQNPTLATITRLAKTLGVSVDELLK